MQPYRNAWSSQPFFSHIYFIFKLETFVPTFTCNKGIIIFTSFNCSNLRFPLLRATKIPCSCPSSLQVSVGRQTWQPSICHSHIDRTGTDGLVCSGPGP